jgi:hypothetical protein
LTPLATANISCYVLRELTCVGPHSMRQSGRSSALTERVQVYAQVIHDLTAELSQLRQKLTKQGNIILLPGRRTLT